MRSQGVHPLDALRGVQQEDPRDPMLQSFDVAGGSLLRPEGDID